MITMHYQLEGRVQGVGYRYFLTQKAPVLQIDGWVANHSDGSLEVVVQGRDRDVIHFEEIVRKGPPGASVTRFVGKEISHDPQLKGFRIRGR